MITMASSIDGWMHLQLPLQLELWHRGAEARRPSTTRLRRIPLARLQALAALAVLHLRSGLAAQWAVANQLDQLQRSLQHQLDQLQAPL